MEQTIEKQEVSQEPQGVEKTQKSKVQKQEERDKVIRIISKTIIYILLTIGSLTCIFPFYWMIMSSFKTIHEYESFVPTYFPHEWTGEAYKIAFTKTATGSTGGPSLFSITLVNSLIVGFTSTFLGVALTILAAYAFARMEFKGKNLVFSILLMTMMVPGELFTITNYISVTGFGWRDTYIVMILPFLCSIYYIYLLRNSFKSIPESLYKAAKVDGCSDMKYLLQVMIPLSSPTIISITILKLIATWNSYIWPELVNTPTWRLVSNWMSTAGQGGAGQRVSDGTDYPVKLAASLIISIPLFIVFIFFRKYIMRGVSKSGIKG
ncbi:MAG: carbohydrate ABC transporter permease [Acholeplasmatales bacterium]|nr:carbohydrate ABC transporter permease [Acholeplasmatales bacterium]